MRIFLDYFTMGYTVFDIRDADVSFSHLFQAVNRPFDLSGAHHISDCIDYHVILVPSSLMYGFILYRIKKEPPAQLPHDKHAG